MEYLLIIRLQWWKTFTLCGMVWKKRNTLSSLHRMVAIFPGAILNQFVIFYIFYRRKYWLKGNSVEFESNMKINKNKVWILKVEINQENHDFAETVQRKVFNMRTSRLTRNYKTKDNFSWIVSLRVAWKEWDRVLDETRNLVRNHEKPECFSFNWTYIYIQRASGSYYSHR
jgi:hypothetical protein